jgi:hypothetical protein
LGKPDGWAPPVSVRRKRKRKRGSGWAGGVACWAAWAGNARAHVLAGERSTAREALQAEGKKEREKEKKVGGEELGRKRERERGERFGFFFLKFFSNSFSNFQTFKLHSNKKTMHSNHDAQELIISNIIEMLFKYFKGQFI